MFREYYDIGIAIGGGKGLVVPVLRNAERLSFAEIENQIADFAQRALEDRLKVDELQGGTFTISNGGIYGSLLSTPIVNPPQSGVLGMHAIEERAVVRNGQIVARPMMYVALTYDHRIVDGREAVTFLKRIKELVEEPARLIFLGRIDAYNKGLDALIDALPQVASLFDVELTLQGPDWGDRAGLEGRAARGMAAHRIRFIEPDFVQAPPRLIAGHDLFCLPSRVEGFGLAALEAMLAGRVLLVSERAGIARHVRAADCGITVQPVAADIARGLLALLKRRAEWREMGLAGRRYALANLQWKDIAAGVLAEYERITD